MIFFCELVVEMARNVKDVIGLDTIGEQEDTHPYLSYNKSYPFWCAPYIWATIDNPWEPVKCSLEGDVQEELQS